MAIAKSLIIVVLLALRGWLQQPAIFTQPLFLLLYVDSVRSDCLPLCTTSYIHDAAPEPRLPLEPNPCLFLLESLTLSFTHLSQY